MTGFVKWIFRQHRYFRMFVLVFVLAAQLPGTLRELPRPSGLPADSPYRHAAPRALEAVSRPNLRSPHAVDQRSNLGGDRDAPPPTECYGLP